MNYKSLVRILESSGLLLTLVLVHSAIGHFLPTQGALAQETNSKRFVHTRTINPVAERIANTAHDELITTSVITVNVTQLATSPALPNVIMATLDNSITPTYSLNGGTCWESLRTTPFNESPQIAIAPRSDGTPRFMAAVQEAGVYRTGDYGLTWAQQAFPRLPTCPASSPAAVYFPQLIASPANPKRLYLRILNSCPDILPWFENGIYISSDSGINWVLGATTWVNESVYEVIPSPVLPERLYAKFSQGWGTFWQRSDDGGHTWTGTLIPVDKLVLDSQDSKRLYGINSSDGRRFVEGDENWTLWAEQPCSAYQQLLAHPTISNTLLLRCEQGLYRSFNGGDHWQQLSTSAGQFLAADYSRPGRIFWARDSGLWASADAGATWFPLVPSWYQLLPCPSIYLPLVAK
jgi:hypothetical protein